MDEHEQNGFITFGNSTNTKKDKTKINKNGKEERCNRISGDEEIARWHSSLAAQDW